MEGYGIILKTELTKGADSQDRAGACTGGSAGRRSPSSVQGKCMRRSPTCRGQPEKAWCLSCRTAGNKLDTQTTLGVGAFLFLTWFLVGADKEVYLEVLKLLVVFVGGLGSGYGIKSRAGKDE